MGKYLIAGWEHYAFIVTPCELEAILQDMHLLIVTHHVPKGYRETPLSDFVADYSAIYEKLRTGKQVTSRDVWSYLEIGVASTLDKYAYGRLHTYRGEEYLSRDFEEPCAMIGRFPMHLLRGKDGKTSLTITFGVDCFPEKMVGLELLVPKLIQFPTEEGYEPLHSTREMDAYRDFLLLRDRIKAITKPLRVRIEDREVRPRVRISEAALGDIGNFWFFRNNPVYPVK